MSKGREAWSDGLEDPQEGEGALLAGLAPGSTGLRTAGERIPERARLVKTVSSHGDGECFKWLLAHSK